MKFVRGFLAKGVLCLLAAALFSYSHNVLADSLSGQVTIKAVKGSATFSTGGEFKPLEPGTELGRGSTVKTGPDGAVDLVLQYNGTVLRLIHDSELTFDKLDKATAGEQVITETSVHLLAGSVIGSQRKLAKPSTFQIAMGDGVATIVGTEYLVRADGAVTVLSGSVKVIYNLPGNGGSVQVDVPAGYSFDPKTGKVVPTTSAFLQNIIADVDTVRENARVFKTGGATIVIKPEGPISPIKPKGNNGVGNGIDPQPPGNPPVNDGPGTGPGNPGNKGGAHDTNPKGNGHN
jgi:hypothetical protein